MDIFTKAAANLPLTPVQRAVLKLLEGFFVSACLVALQTFAQYMAAGRVDVQQAGHTALIAGAVAFLLAVAKYYKAFGDTGAQVVAAVASQAASVLESTTPSLYTRAEQGATPTTDAQPAQ